MLNNQIMLLFHMRTTVEELFCLSIKKTCLCYTKNIPQDTDWWKANGMVQIVHMDKFAYTLTVFAWKLSKRRVLLVVVRYSISNSIINEWNILGKRIIEANSLSGFKRKLHSSLLLSSLNSSIKCHFLTVTRLTWFDGLLFAAAV